MIANMETINRQHYYHSAVEEKYTILEYIPGKIVTRGKQTKDQMKNPIWKVLDKDGVDFYVMYCETDTLCKLCKLGYDRFTEFQKGEGINLIWYNTYSNYIQAIDGKTKKIYHISNIVTGITERVKYIDGDKYNNFVTNLRMCNVKSVPIKKDINAVHPYNSYIEENYQVIEYIPGHYTDVGKGSYVMKNPIWKVLIGDKTYYLLYCENDILCKLCEESYQKVKEFDSSVGKVHTWHKTYGGVHTFHRIEKTSYYIHQVIMGYKKHSDNLEKKHQYIKHIDDDLLNNSIENLTLMGDNRKQSKTTKILETTIDFQDTSDTTICEIECLQNYSAIETIEELPLEPIISINESIIKKIDDSYHHYHSIISENYTILEYIPGHVNTMGRYANCMKNPVWKVQIDEKEYYLMYCETNCLCKLCPESYKIIKNYHRDIGKNVTWSKCSTGYIQSHNSHNDKSYFIHQIIMDCYGNGKGTKTISVDHIDRDPLNNTLENLRLANNETQQQNKKGHLTGTKRERKHSAIDLPSGITQVMMRKYVVYYHEWLDKDKTREREFFKVEKHPKLNDIWFSSKSNKISIQEKLNQANKVVDDLENDIQPIKEGSNVPKYVSLGISRGKPHLVFEKRMSDGKRLNFKMVLPDEYELSEQLSIFDERILKKYEKTREALSE